MRRRCWFWTASLLVGVAGCGSHGETAREEGGHAEKGEAHVIVRAEATRLGNMTESVEGLGRCEALPDHIATLTPAVEGHVHELLVTQGQEVKKGQPILELDPTVARADLAEKVATRDGLKASLTLLKSLPRAEESRSLELAVETAKLAVTQAKAAVERLRPLQASHEVSEQAFFDAGKALEHDILLQQTAEAQLRVTRIGPRPEAIAEAEGKIKTADAAVALSQAHLDFHTIHAPIDGVLDSLTCHPGQVIAIGTAIGEVVDTRQIFAAVWLPPRSASAVHVGQAARVVPANTREPSGEASRTGDTGLDGKVAFVGRIADPQTGSLPVHVLVDNPKSVLTLGESVRVSILMEERKGVLQVPAAAILDLGEGPVLNVVRDGKAAVLHPELGAAQGGWVEVKGTDLKEGEPAIIEGGYNLPEGTPVKIGTAEKAEEDKDKGHEEKTEDAKAAPATKPATKATPEAAK
jgi:RND family efflux transporter MFP subunit